MPEMDEAEVGKLLGDVTVSYTVRELLSRIEERLVRMETRAEDVATRASVEALSQKVDTRVDALAQKVDSLESIRDRMMGAAFAVGALAGGGAGWVANLLSSR